MYPKIAANNEIDYGSYSDVSKQIKFMNATVDIQLPNFQNAKIINSNGSIYLLNGIDLFAVNVQSEGGDNLKKIGSLGGVNNQPISDIKVHQQMIGLSWSACHRSYSLPILCVGITMEELHIIRC